jgi:uncharacterized membrane protein
MTVRAGDDNRGRENASSWDTEEDFQASERLRTTESEPGPEAATDSSAAGRAGNGRRGLERHRRGPGGSDADLEGIPVPPLNVENIAVATEAAVQVLRQWSAPMPDPATLREYEEILPGAAERILQMAEVAAKGRHELNVKLVDAELESAKAGRNYAFFLAVTAMAAAIAFFAFGNLIAGGLLLSTPVVLMIQAMIGGREPKGQ